MEVPAGDANWGCYGPSLVLVLPQPVLSTPEATALDPAPPGKKGTAHTQFLAHVYCGQTAGWIKVLLGTEVNRGPADVVLDGVTAPP